MKKFTTLCLAGLVATAVFGQKPVQTKNVANLDQMTKAETYQERLDQILQGHDDESMLRAKQVVDYIPTLAPNGKTAMVNPVMCGRASNVFTCLRAEQNQVYANDSLDMVLFIHRHDITIWGGGGSENGKYRYDVSIDGGATFSNDIGVMNNLYSRPARYPNVTAFNNSGTTDPLQANVVYSGPTLDPQPDWDGYVTGFCDVAQSGTGNCTETYSLLGAGTLLQGGLTEALAGEFWTTDFEYVSGATTGRIFINKGTYNSSTQDIDWVRHDSLNPTHETALNGGPVLIGPNIAFSPDGQTGWIAWLGDLQGGLDSTVNAIFVKSTDAGDTWGSPMEVSTNTASWVSDSLKALWTDSLGNPASSGRATLAFDFDLTVDMNGNPHLVAVVGSGSTVAAPDPAYSIFSGLAKFLGDIWSPDGGATWDVAYISPCLAFRGSFGQGSNPIGMDNHPQVARSADGSHIFYSFVDSDTATMFGNMTGIGFGQSDQLAPNLITAAKRVSDGFQTYPKLITHGDLIWDGRVLFPNMAPEVIKNGNVWEQAIVVAEMLANDALQSTQFWYFGNDVTIDPSVDEFCDPNTMNLGWFDIITGNTACTVDLEAPVQDQVVLHQSFPNPTAGEAVIRFELLTVANVSMNLVNMYGQTVATLVDGELAAGMHDVVAKTSELATGVYFYNLTVNDKVYTKKMIVTK